MKKSKYQQYFHCFTACTLDPYAFWFSLQLNIVTALISEIFRGATLIRIEVLISMWIPRGVALIRWRPSFGVRRLLEEIQYFHSY